MHEVEVACRRLRLRFCLRLRLRLSRSPSPSPSRSRSRSRRIGCKPASGTRPGCPRRRWESRKTSPKGSQSHQNLRRRGRRGRGDGRVLFHLLLLLVLLLFKSTLPFLPAPSLPRLLPRIALPSTAAFSSLFSYFLSLSSFAIFLNFASV